MPGFSLFSFMPNSDNKINMDWPDEIDLTEEKLAPGGYGAPGYGRGWARELQSTFSEREITELAISVGVMSIAFSFLFAGDIAYLFEGNMLPLVQSFIIVCTAFVLHELAHKFTARRYGLWAEYRMWVEGLMFALILPIITMGHLIFAAPGAVYITGRHLSKKEDGIISLTGPVTNILLIIIFLIGFIISAALFPGTDGFLTTLCLYGVLVNLILAAFNMLPLPPLDGAAVMKWSPLIWGVIAMPLFMLVILVMVFGIS